jgi:hypothetical protein
MDRVDGKPKQSVEVEHISEIPVKIVSVEGFTGWDKPVDEKESE